MNYGRRCINFSFNILLLEIIEAYTKLNKKIQISDRNIFFSKSSNQVYMDHNGMSINIEFKQQSCNSTRSSYFCRLYSIHYFNIPSVLKKLLKNTI